MSNHLFRNPVFFLPLLIAALICQSSIARATTRTVTSNFDGDTGGTLRDAIMASDNGDTITFSAQAAPVAVIRAESTRYGL